MLYLSVSGGIAHAYFTVSPDASEPGRCSFCGALLRCLCAQKVPRVLGKLML